MSTESPDTHATPLGEIEHGPSKLEQFLERNQKLLVLVGILLIVCVAAYVVWDGIKSSHEQTAGANLIEGKDTASLEKVLKENADTQAAGSAALLLAEEQWKAGQEDEALATLRKFIQGSPKHPAVPSANASLASHLMAQGKIDEASQIFQNIADSPDSRFVAPYALISLGDIALNAGDSGKAEGFYKRVEAEFSGTSYVSVATSRLSVLNAKPPIEVDAPPAPATPPADAQPTTPGSPIAVAPGQTATVPPTKVEVSAPVQTPDAPENPE